MQERQNQIDAAIEKLRSGESKNEYNDAEATRAAAVVQGLAAGHAMDAAQLVADALDRSTAAAGQGHRDIITLQRIATWAGVAIVIVTAINVFVAVTGP